MVRNIETPEFKDSNLAGHHAIATVLTSAGKNSRSIAVNLSTALGKREKQVCLITTAPGSGQSEQYPDNSLEELLTEQKALADILVDGAEGTRILSAGSIFARFSQMGKIKQELLIDLLAKLEAAFDYVIVEAHANAVKELVHLFKALPLLLCIKPQADSLTAAFELMRQLKHQTIDQPIQVLVEMATDLPHAHDTFKKLRLALAKYLQLEAHYLGYLPRPQLVPNPIPSSTSAEHISSALYTWNHLDSLVDRFCALHQGSSATPSLSHYYQRLCCTDQSGDIPAARLAMPTPIEKAGDPCEAEPRTGSSPVQEQIWFSDRAALLAAIHYASLLANRETRRLVEEHTD